MTTARTAIAGLTTFFAVAGLATSGYIQDEGWVLKTYKDPVGIATGCAGLTGAKYGIEPGKTYTEEECERKTAHAFVDHYYDTRRCMPATIPNATSAALLRNTLNLGSTKFCVSSMARKAVAGDIKGACEAMDLYVFANGKYFPGLAARRAREKALCLEGLG